LRFHRWARKRLVSLSFEWIHTVFTGNTEFIFSLLEIGFQLTIVKWPILESCPLDMSIFGLHPEFDGRSPPHQGAINKLGSANH